VVGRGDEIVTEIKGYPPWRFGMEVALCMGVVLDRLTSSMKA
jgi:hypothetical protein